MLWHFDWRGRHLETVDALTLGRLYEFRYDGDGHLTEIEDGDGEVTTIEWHGDGTPEAIVSPAPYSHRTELGVDADGRVDSITSGLVPGAAAVYDIFGLMTTWTDPRGTTRHYTYWPDGRLWTYSAPSSGVRIFSRSEVVPPPADFTFLSHVHQSSVAFDQPFETLPSLRPQCPPLATPRQARPDRGLSQGIRQERGQRHQRRYGWRRRPRGRSRRRARLAQRMRRRMARAISCIAAVESHSMPHIDEMT